MLHRKIDVLVVDDEPEVASCLSDALTGDQFACACSHNANDAIDRLQRQSFDVILADLVMPEIDGLELLDQVRAQYPQAAGVLMSGRITPGMAKTALRSGIYDVIHKPFDIADVRRVLAEACAARRAELDSLSGRESVRPVDPVSESIANRIDVRSQLVQLLTATLAAKDEYTRLHSIRTAYYADHIGRHLNLTARQLDSLRNAAMVHDIGKIGVPDAILTKPGPLTADEFAIMQRHPQMGYNILQNAGCLREELRAVLHHHEWWNGSGYPGGLKKTAIPLGARIIHVADTIDAMFSQRNYAERNEPAQVVEELELGLGSQFDPEIGRIAADWIESRPQKMLSSSWDPDNAGFDPNGAPISVSQDGC
ncbi:MAG: response regulator [Gammaproteobacteria bacterium]|nr:response regulator [Gammaproteobacteria bacterium]